MARRSLVVQTRELGLPTDAPLDRAIEVSLHVEPRTTGFGAGPVASIYVFDEQGSSLAPPFASSASAGDDLRVVIARRVLRPYEGRAVGVALSGPAPFLADLAARLSGRSQIELVAAARGHGVAIGTLVLDEHPLGRPYDAAAVDEAERLVTIDPLRALALVDAVRGAAAGADAARADMVGAEAAYAFGRARLAARFADRGLALSPDVRVAARLLRVLVLVEIEESVSKEAPPSRARLAATSASRADPLEIALDAALDVRVAEVHDRTFPLVPRAPAAATQLLSRLKELEAAEPDAQWRSDRPRFAAAICRAARHLADGKPDDPATPLLERGALWAREGGRVADEVMCAIKAGDVARAFGRFDEAARHFARARELLGDRRLPREQREAAFSAALLADARGDHAEALRAALVSCRFIDELLAMESDLAAREALISFVVGYYGVTELFAVRAGAPALAVAIGESGKARAFGALLAGPSGVDATASAAWVENRALAPEDDASKVSALAASLGPGDAAISLMQVGTDARGYLQHAVGVVTRDGVTVRVTTHSKTFLADVVAHGEAIERGDEATARALGARIYDELLRPTEDLWAGKTRLFVSPNRRLQSLSFAALHDGHGWLVERVAIARVPPFFTAPRDVGDDAVRLRGARWLFALDPAHPPLDRLPGLVAVGDQLTPLVKPVATMKGPEVTTGRLLREASSVDALLYAGHAEYSPERPLESALLVTPSKSDPQGKVFAWSALGLPRPPRVVLLIGCETARLWKGAASFSDDFIGLPRAFLAAGARHVVGALWPVIDRDAEDFLRAVFAVTDDVDPVRAIGRAQACLATRKCASRGVAAWASYVVDSR